ncbi:MULTISPECIES: GDSL-type esterase/lipase family protein [Sphingobium]|uniref:GDSL-type esterase/lipase family protein n=1 Tax=Sphingobium sp. MI1205 TaxID=407020 RepID=UPI00077062C4|nr:GDSL-type esterase/lipase family protein [Sphingobium sp. MI1205]AMK16765.1 putative lipolytic enzyme [Sphingobium sp. MI1205]
MPTANISCAPSIGISAGKRLPALRIALAALALLLPPGTAAAQSVAPGSSDAPRVNADPAFPFSNEIAAFAKANGANDGPPDGILFLGSSSIRLWNTGGSFPDEATVNRGFGGATTPDVLHYYPRLLPHAAPRSILVYVGENDLAAGATPAAVAHDLLALLKKLRADYPRSRIAFLSLKPSPIRWTLWPKMAAVNMTVAARSRVGRFDYLDVGSALLARDGLPDASLFRPDGLHMNARGYSRWTRLVDSWLDRGETASVAGQPVTTGPVARSASLSD